MRHFTGKKRLFVIPLFLLGFVAIGFITMSLWNALLPAILHLPEISFWQAIGLLILSRLLLGFHGPWGGHFNHRRGMFRDKWEQMTPEQREEFKKHLHEHRFPWGRSRDDRANQDIRE